MQGRPSLSLQLPAHFDRALGRTPSCGVGEAVEVEHLELVFGDDLAGVGRRGEAERYDESHFGPSDLLLAEAPRPHHSPL